MAKLGDRVSLRVAKHVSDKEALRPSSHLHVAETRNASVVSQKHLHVSCYKCVARYKVSEVAKLSDLNSKSKFIYPR